MVNLVLIISLIVLIALLILIFPFLFFGAPFDISRKAALENIVKLTDPKAGDRIAELGSGDGRVCIALAKKNPKAIIYGFEINPLLVFISKRKVKKSGFASQIKIKWKNFWKIDMSMFNKIVLFQFDTVMPRLEKKLEKESKKGTIIVSHNWKFPDWKIEKTLGEKHLSYGEVYLYRKK